MLHDDCLFCGIINGTVDTNKVYEDENVLAFEDVNPQMPVHTLIVPKDHYENLTDEIPAEVLSNLFGAVNKIAQIKGVDKSGYRIVVNNGADAQQAIHHIHIHVLGGAPMNSGDPSQL